MTDSFKDSPKEETADFVGVSWPFEGSTLKNVPIDGEPVAALVALPVSKMFEDIRAFHEKFEQAYDGLPRALEPGLADFRAKFMQEELDEYRDIAGPLQRAIEAGDDAEVAYFLDKQFDALIDLVYVAMGAAYLHGFRFWAEGWRRVHRKNMEKVLALKADPDAVDSGRDKKYDVVKPAGWTPPSHIDLVENHAHRQTSLPL